MTNSNTTTNTVLEQALFLSEKMGWSVIPVSIDKKPLVEWKLYQTQKATRDQIGGWFSNPEVNLGVVTGKISNLVVVDIDPRHEGTDEAFEEVQTVKSATGGGGWHYFFKYEEGIQNQAGIKPGIDVRGEGGYVIVPPSTHKSGNPYKWLNSPEDTKVIDIPEFVQEWISSVKVKEGPKESKWNNKLLNGVSEGKRNDAAASVIGKWLKRYPEEEWESEVWPMAQIWNKDNQPPLPENELRIVYESIVKSEKANQEDEESERRSVADKIVDLVFRLEVELYLDDTGEPHITFPERPIVGFPIKGSVFRRWIAGKYWQEYNKGFSGESFQQAVSSIEGKAYHEEDTRVLFNRIARLDNAIYYDLGDDKKVVKITTKGWEITESCPVRFRRFNHQIAQAEPITGGSLETVLKYLNLKTETDKLLFLTYLLTVFIPDIPRVVLVNIGDQGSAKSTALRVARSLIDPSISALLSPPSDINELAQASNHHYCLYLDNLSYLRDELSDALCRLATGIGFTKRKLFTNDEDILFTQKAAVGMTGINLIATRADLLDRCLILSFERIPEEMRIDEEDFWNNFDRDKPFILGSIFDKLAQILGTAPEFKLKRKPRMADYAKYAAISAVTLGKSPEEFLDAFGENIERQNQAAIESSPTAQSILQFMSDKDEWNGPSSELHKLLKAIVEKTNLQIGGSDGFPKSSNWLWKRIMQIRPNLLSLGITASKSEILSGSEITLKKSSQEDKNAATAANSANGQPDMATVAVKQETLEGMPTISSIQGLEDYR